MASENKNENVMLSGKTAYFKKTGSMTNYGTINLNNQESNSSYGPGFIDVNSVINKAELEKSNEYAECVTEMKSYLQNHYDDTLEGYEVENNANITHNLLEPSINKIHTIAYNTSLDYKQSKVEIKTEPDIEPIIIEELPLNFKIALRLAITNTGNRVLYKNEDETLILKIQNGKLVLVVNEDTFEMNTIFGGEHLYELQNTEDNLIFTIDKLDYVVTDALETQLTNIYILPENILGIIYNIDIIDLEENDLLHRYCAVYERTNGVVGILDYVTSEFYLDENDAIPRYTKLYPSNNSIYAPGTLYIETDFIPDHDTVYEFKCSSRYSTSTDTCYFAADGGAWSANNVIFNPQGSAKKCGWFYSSSAYTWEDSSQYSTYTYEFYRGTVKRSGTTLNTNNNKNNSVTFAKLRLFKGHHGSSCGNLYFYYMKCYNNDTNELLAEFIPCKDLDDVICIYDTVSKKVYYGIGTGKFS